MTYLYLREVSETLAWGETAGKSGGALSGPKGAGLDWGS